MGMSKLTAGGNVPDEVNVVIEIPANSDPVKYEINKETGLLFVDRFMMTCMHYPCNYGYIPGTLYPDGDPLDVLVDCPFPLFSNAVVRCRPVGILNMEDEQGIDSKIIAVPISKSTPLYDKVKNPEDLSPALLHSIEHFFSHYKDLEPNKWVKIHGWSDTETAKLSIMDSVKRYILHSLG